MVGISALQKSSQFRLAACAYTACSALKPKASNTELAKPCGFMLLPISQDSKSFPMLLKEGYAVSLSTVVSVAK